jgi:hypothetical protein
VKPVDGMEGLQDKMMDLLRDNQKELARNMSEYSDRDSNALIVEERKSIDAPKSSQKYQAIKMA